MAETHADIEADEDKIALSSQFDEANLNNQELKKKRPTLLDDISFDKEFFLSPKGRLTFSGFYGEQHEDMKGVEVSLLSTAEDYLAFRLGISLSSADGYYFLSEEREREDNKDIGYAMITTFAIGYLHANTKYVNPYYGIGFVGGSDLVTAFKFGSSTSASRVEYGPESDRHAPASFVALYQEFGLSFEFGEYQIYPFMRRYYDGEEFHGQPHYGISISTFLFPD